MHVSEIHVYTTDLKKKSLSEKLCMNHHTNRCSLYATLQPQPLDYFQQLVFFALIINVILICKTKTSYHVNWRRNHPYNRSTFWQSPMHSLWNKRTFHAEKQVYFIYFKIKNYFELSIHTLYHGYSVKLTLS